MNINQSDIKRFWAKVSKGGNDDCWLWIGACDTKRYGRFYLDGKVRQATHVSYLIHNKKEISPNKEACHNCDNPQCVNYYHIWEGTTLENAEDMVKKGRHSHGEKHSEIQKKHVQSGDSHWTHRKPELVRYGEKASRKLNGRKVSAIRKLLAKGTNQYVIAKKYCVTQAVISNIKTGKTWSRQSIQPLFCGGLVNHFCATLYTL